MKIVSVVVTFNRKNDLLTNLKSQLDQSVPFDKIIIVDNASTDGTREFLSENGILDDPCIDYHLMPDNLGGAGGFEQGVKLAHQTDADAYVLMDDDGFMFTQDTVKNLIAHIPNDNRLYMLNSWLVFDKANPVYASDENFHEEEIVGFISPFNSTLVSRELVDKIGYPNGDFFIRGDEVDYCMRAKDAGAYVATVCSSHYYHPKLCSEKKICGISFSGGVDSPWKAYYGTRNTTYRMRKKSKMRAWLSYRKRILGLYVFKVEDKKTMKKFIKLGYKHGKRGILGKTIQPGQKDIDPTEKK